MNYFDKVLVANRGEIALRVLRTCRDLGLGTVAVCSEADVGAPPARFADEAVTLGPAPASESYLVAEKIIDAARCTGAQAIHPGYGFLAESAAFARAVEAAGLVFIGPSADAIDKMGSKIAARALMEPAGVPIIPGYSGDDQRPATLIAEARRIGFPVLIKASAGGGGKGMSIVRSADEMSGAVDQARRLASAAFGDDALLLEKYIESPRHVEVQILGDRHGTVIHCHERECSVQRRFQKIIEETPSPGVDRNLRAALCDAAVTAGRALGYYSAGTVEFIVGQRGEFYFLEVNTRLQVEHPVTEAVTGLDLVRLQILVAQGLPLPFEPREEVRAHGHALECRLYAEDPARDFLPATGRLAAWIPPQMAGVRIDSGVETGSEIGIDYDPMLAKVITWAPTRVEAIGRMVGALRRFVIQGVTTNRDFLVQILRHEAFVAGRLSTHFIDDHFPPEARAVSARAGVADAAVAAVLFDAEGRRAAGPLPQLRAGWRNSPYRPQDAVFKLSGGGEVRVDYTALDRRRYEVAVDGGAERRVTLLERDESCLRLDFAGHQCRFHVVVDGEHRYVHGPGGAVALRSRSRFPAAEVDEAAGGCVAPMPGKVVAVLVEPGQRVAAGTRLVVLEAMKMEHTLNAPDDATVSAVRCAPGDRVDAGAVLVELEPLDE